MSNKIGAIMAVISAYWTISTTMVFLNKKLVSEGGAASGNSVFVVWAQNVIGAILFQATKFFAKFLRLPGLDLQLGYKQEILHKDVVLASASYTCMLVFNNLMLQQINVSFYQIARSLNMIFVIIFSSFILRERIVMKYTLPCILIFSGFYLGVNAEILSEETRPVGILYGVASSVMSALSGIFFKRMQNNKGITALKFTYYNFVISSVALTPLVLFTSQISNVITFSVVFDSTFCILLILSGVAGLGMGWVSCLEISLTSPLTHIVSTNAKSVFLTVLAVAWNGEARGLLWWMGNGLVVSGSSFYALNKLRTRQKYVSDKSSKLTKVNYYKI